MKTTRRYFLRNVSAGTVSAWLLPFAARKVFAQESLRKPADPRLKHRYLSVCRQCSAGCGVLAEVVQGKVKKLLG
ncbi:MAG: hypothetical protein HY900_17500, partial [Deltaproteobacteria bacterium]|nr:hypothetical protein [Deltaproteobacteria bacterium]